MKILLASVKTKDDIEKLTSENTDKKVYGITNSGSLYVVDSGVVS